jgi:transposase-like protein
LAQRNGLQPMKIETILRDAVEDQLAFTGFPPAYWTEIWPPNPFKRLNEQVKAPDSLNRAS